MTRSELSTQRGPWRFVWHGGRLCDVHHAEYEHAIDCKQVPGWSDELDRSTSWHTKHDRAALADAADEWMRTSEPDYRRELPYLR